MSSIQTTITLASIHVTYLTFNVLNAIIDKTMTILEVLQSCTQILSLIE